MTSKCIILAQQSVGVDLIYYTIIFSANKLWWSLGEKIKSAS